MLCDCHIHIILDGEDFSFAINSHKEAIIENTVISNLKQYADLGVSYLRDGGDNLGVSLYASKVASMFGIEYVSPAFAIHKKGKYGGIVGKSFDTEAEFLALLDEAESLDADFIKLMLSGIMDFNEYGVLTCEPVTADEMKSMVEHAKKRGFSVMAHVNGDEAIRNAVIAGVDSIEHGYYMEDDTVKFLTDSGTIWTPTLSPIGNIINSGRFDRDVLLKIYDVQCEKIALAAKRGAYIAQGSDGGAWQVLHGHCVNDELRHLETVLGATARYDLALGNNKVRERFEKKHPELT